MFIYTIVKFVVFLYNDLNNSKKGKGKYEKVSYSVTFEIKDEVMNMHFRSTPYEKEEITVDCDCIEAVRFGFLQNTRTGVTGIGLEFEDAEEIIGVVPTICFNYWVFLDVEEDTLKETMKTLLEVIVPSDCIQLIKYLRSTPAYLA